MKHSSGRKRGTIVSVQVILSFSFSNCASLPPSTCAVAVFIWITALLTRPWRSALVTCSQINCVLTADCQCLPHANEHACCSMGGMLTFLYNEMSGKERGQEEG